MRATLQNSGMVLSMILFFSIIIFALSGAMPSALFHGLTDAGLPVQQATRIAALPPTAASFAAFLGYNPMQQMLPPPLLGALPPAVKLHLLARSFFRQLMAAPLSSGLRFAFYVAAAVSLIAAIASMLRGRQTYAEDTEPAEAGAEVQTTHE